jgi:hypothetical protein
MARCVWCITLRPSSCVVRHPLRYVGVTNHTTQERAGCDAPHPPEGQGVAHEGRGVAHRTPGGAGVVAHRTPGGAAGWHIAPQEGWRVAHCTPGGGGGVGGGTPHFCRSFAPFCFAANAMRKSKGPPKRQRPQDPPEFSEDEDSSVYPAPAQTSPHQGQWLGNAHRSRSRTRD